VDTDTYLNLHAIETLVNRFLDKSLPKEEWTHNAHLTTGLYFVAKHGPAAAMETMREGISAYNEAVGGINSDTSGYHETITQFWIWLLNVYWERVAGKEDLIKACNEFLNSNLAVRDIFLKFYSRELLFSKEARKGFVSPDLAGFYTTIIFAQANLEQG
jgi:hypothetical protein